jgi:hypothetical protein
MNTFRTPERESRPPSEFLLESPKLQSLLSVYKNIDPKLIVADPSYDKLLGEVKRLKSNACFATIDGKGLKLQPVVKYVVVDEREIYADYIESSSPELKQAIEELEKGFNESFDEQEKLINDCSVLANKNQELLTDWLCSSRLLNTAYKISFSDQKHPADRKEYAKQAVATPFDTHRTPPPNIPKDCFPSAERNDVEKQLSVFKPFVLEKGFQAPNFLRNCEDFQKPRREEVLDRVESIHKTREGLAAALQKAEAIKSTLNQLKQNTKDLVDYKNLLTTQLEETQTVINAQLQAADRHLEKWQDLTKKKENKKEGKKNLESDFNNVTTFSTTFPAYENRAALFAKPAARVPVQGTFLREREYQRNPFALPGFSFETREPPPLQSLFPPLGSTLITAPVDQKLNLSHFTAPSLSNPFALPQQSAGPQNLFAQSLITAPADQKLNFSNPSNKPSDAQIDRSAV